MTLEKQNEEIDLIKVFISIYKFLRKNVLILFISGIIGGFLGYSTKFFVQKIYTSSMLIESYTLKDDVIIEHMNNINSIIKDKNYKYLSELLEIDSDQLIKIEANKLEHSKYKETNYIKVVVETKNNTIYKTLSKSLLNYLAKSIYIKDQIKIFRDQNEYLINKLDNQIQLLEEMDTIKKSEINIYNNKTSFHNNLIYLVKERQEIQKQLTFASPFRVISDFVIFLNPKNKTVTYSFLGALSLSFLSLLILLFKKINENIIKYLQRGF